MGRMTHCNKKHSRLCKIYFLCARVSQPCKRNQDSEKVSQKIVVLATRKAQFRTLLLINQQIIYLYTQGEALWEE